MIDEGAVVEAAMFGDAVFAAASDADAAAASDEASSWE